MKSFVWSEEFDTGIGEVDEQHKNLVRMINRFGEREPLLIDEFPVVMNRIRND